MTGRRRVALTGCAAALALLTAAGLDQLHHGKLDRFVAVALLQAAVYGAALALVWNSRTSRGELAAILTVAVLLRLPVLWAPPYLSSDVYRYVWDGRVEAAGINPYRYIPVDPHLAALRDIEIFPRINRAAYAPTIYPPLAEAIFWAVAQAGGSVTAIKAAMVGFEAVTAALLLLMLAAAEAPLGRVLAYAWHPLPLWEFAGSGHIDAALVAFVALALWAWSRRRGGLAGAALAAATLTKLYPAVLLPALRWRREWRAPLVFAAAIVLGYLPYLRVGWKVLGFLPGYAGEEGFTGAGRGFYLLDLLQKFPPLHELPAVLYLLVAGAVLAGLALATGVSRAERDKDFACAALLAGVFTLLLSPHYPWYFAWLVLFGCFAPYFSLLWLTNIVFLLYLVQVGSPLMQQGYRFSIETIVYGPFAVLALADLRRRRAARRG